MMQNRLRRLCTLILIITAPALCMSCTAKNRTVRQKPVLTLAAQNRSSGPVISPPLIAQQGEKLTLFSAASDGTIAAWRIPQMSMIWKTETDLSFEAPLLLSEGIIYAASLEGGIVALDSQNGKLLRSAEGLGQIKGGLTADPDGGSLYAGSYDNTMYRIAVPGLETIWQYRAGNFINGRALIAGDSVVFGSCDAQLHVVDRQTGKESAKVQAGSYIPATPASDEDGTVYFACYEGEVTAWSRKDGIRWNYRNEEYAPIRSPVTLTGDYVIVSDQRGRITAVDKTEGNEVWHFDSGSPVDFEAVAAPAGIITASSDGSIYILDTASGKELFSYPAGSLPSLGGAWHDPWFAIGTSEGLLLLFRFELKKETVN